MRIFYMLLICFSCCFCVGCLQQTTAPDSFIPAVQLQKEKPAQCEYKKVSKSSSECRNFQYYSSVYQQWIILGVYVLTTLIMAFYTRKQDKKRAAHVKHVADTLLVGPRGKPGILFRLFRLFSRNSKK